MFIIIRLKNILAWWTTYRCFVRTLSSSQLADTLSNLAPHFTHAFPKRILLLGLGCDIIPQIFEVLVNGQIPLMLCHTGRFEHS